MVIWSNVLTVCPRYTNSYSYPILQHRHARWRLRFLSRLLCIRRARLFSFCPSGALQARRSHRQCVRRCSQDMLLSGPLHAVRCARRRVAATVDRSRKEFCRSFCELAIVRTGIGRIGAPTNCVRLRAYFKGRVVPAEVSGQESKNNLFGPSAS